MGEAHLCAQCGVQFPEAEHPPEHCAICEDERQFVHPAGQTWTTLTELRATHQNVVLPLEPGLTSFRTRPTFAMGHQALLIESPHGNVLWDCISLLDESTVEAVEARGGLSAIAISHPHFYDTMVEWSRAFGDAPIYLHAADRQWVMRPDPCLVFWDGEARALSDDLTLIHCGGHFAGAAVLHWASGAEGRGALLTGDIIATMPRRDFVTFMYSFPNMIPLSAGAVRRIARAVHPYAFDRLYGIWSNREILVDAKAVVQRSAERYVKALEAP